MSEIDISTVSITSSRRNSRRKKLDNVKPPTHEKLAGWKMPRPTFIAFLTALLLLASWGTWTFFGAASKTDDVESIADLEGFESAAPFLGAPAIDDSSIGGPSDPNSLKSPGINDLTVPKYGSDSSLATTVPAGTPDVWLTGTIEDSEPAVRIELPQRLSGGPGESSILR